MQVLLGVARTSKMVRGSNIVNLHRPTSMAGFVQCVDGFYDWFSMVHKIWQSVNRVALQWLSILSTFRRAAAANFGSFLCKLREHFWVDSNFPFSIVLVLFLLYFLYMYSDECSFESEVLHTLLPCSKPPFSHPQFSLHQLQLQKEYWFPCPPVSLPGSPSRCSFALQKVSCPRTDCLCTSFPGGCLNSSSSSSDNFLPSWFVL